jgi:nitrile hydratase
MGENQDDHHHPAPDERAELSYFEKRTDAIQALLIEKGIITADDVRHRIEALDARTPAQGARVVARAWLDPAFKRRLLANGKTAIAELGYSWAPGVELVVVENTERVHHVVVCTLCSCYPKPLLGPPPEWYKSLAYRSRAVADPRGVLREFGLELDGKVEVRVLDSTADNRYLVLPLRPAGTERMSEAELAELVTRDAMIGVAQPTVPAPAEAS